MNHHTNHHIPEYEAKKPACSGPIRSMLKLSAQNLRPRTALVYLLERVLYPRQEHFSSVGDISSSLAFSLGGFSLSIGAGFQNHNVPYLDGH